MFWIEILKAQNAGSDTVKVQTRLQNLTMMPAICTLQNDACDEGESISVNPTWASGHSDSLQSQTEELANHLPGSVKESPALCACWETDVCSYKPTISIKHKISENFERESTFFLGTQTHKCVK